MDFNTLPANVDLIGLFAQMEKNESELKKNSHALKQIAHEKVVRLTQEHIHHLRQFQRQSGKAAWFNFAFGLIGGLSQVVNAVAPGLGVALGRVFTLAANTAAALAHTLHQLNPFQARAQGAELKAQEYAGLAKLEEGYLKSAEDQVQEHRDRRRQWHQDLEKIMEMKSQSEQAVIRS